MCVCSLSTENLGVLAAVSVTAAEERTPRWADVSPAGVLAGGGRVGGRWRGRVQVLH